MEERKVWKDLFTVSAKEDKEVMASSTIEATGTYQLVLRSLDRVAGTAAQATFNFPDRLLPSRWRLWGLKATFITLCGTADNQIAFHINVGGGHDRNFSSSGTVAGIGPCLAIYFLEAAPTFYSDDGASSNVTIPNPSGKQITITVADPTTADYSVSAAGWGAGEWTMVLTFYPICQDV